ncbi:hypothetical protein [Hymenobacter tenuis]
MEDIRLLLDDYLVDLPAGVGSLLRLSRSGVDINQLDSRGGDASYTFVLPPTRRNDRFFQARRNGQMVDKFLAPRPITAVLYVGGDLFFRGVWQLTSVRSDGYPGKLVAPEVDVFAQIGSKMLSELQFAPLDYQGQHGFAERLALSCADTPIQFPLVAYGNWYDTIVNADGTEQPLPASNDFGTRALEIDDYLPSVSFLPTLRQIFADVGWQIRGEVLDDADVREWCMPFTGAEMPWNWGGLLRLQASGGLPNDGFNVFTADNFVPTAETGQTRSLYWPLQPAVTLNPARRWREEYYGVANQVPTPYHNYEVRLDGGYHLRATLTVTTMGADLAEPTYLAFVWLAPGQAIEEAQVLLQMPVTGAGEYVLDSRELLPVGVYLETGWRVLPVVRRTLGLSRDDGFSLDVAEWSVDVEPVEEEIGPKLLNVAALLPQLSQRDFVKGFFLLKNLRYTTDADARILTFHYHDRYELPPALALDLSAYCSPDEGEYTPALPARRIVLGWQTDESDALVQAKGLGYCDYTFRPKGVVLGVELAEQRLLVPWAPTEFRTYQMYDPELGINAPMIRFTLPCLATKEALETPLNEVSWSYSFAPRLLRYRGLSEEKLPFYFLNARALFGTADTVGLTFAGAGGLYQRHYAGLFEQLARGHKVKLPLALTAALFKKIRPQRPILIHGRLHRLVNIPSFVLEGKALTDVELLRVVLPAEVNLATAPPAETSGVHEFFVPVEFFSGEWY